MGHQLRMLLIQRVERADRRVDGAQQVLQRGGLLLGGLGGGQFGLGPRCCFAGIRQLKPGVVQNFVVSLKGISIQKAFGLKVTQRGLLFVQPVQRFVYWIDILQQPFERVLLLLESFTALLRRFSASAKHAIQIICFIYSTGRRLAEFIQFVAGCFQVRNIGPQSNRGDLVCHYFVSLCITLRASLSII